MFNKRKKSQAQYSPNEARLDANSVKAFANRRNSLTVIAARQLASKLLEEPITSDSTNVVYPEQFKNQEIPEVTKQNIFDRARGSQPVHVRIIAPSEIINSDSSIGI